MSSTFLEMPTRYDFGIRCKFLLRQKSKSDFVNWLPQFEVLAPYNSQSFNEKKSILLETVIFFVFQFHVVLLTKIITLLFLEELLL